MKSTTPRTTPRALSALVLAGALLTAQPALSANVAPLGFEVGVATYNQVKAGLKARLVHTGTNAYSDGPMYESDGEGLDIEGLNKALFIFDAQQRLAGVVLTMADYRFDEVQEFLSGKYKARVRQIPFVGDRYVKFTQGNSIAELSDPHMAFDMEVRYLSNDLVKAFTTRSAASDAERKRQQKAKF